MTDESKAQLSKLWAYAAGSREPLTNSHVIGDLQPRPTVDTIVSQAFVDTLQGFDRSLFEFLEHDKVWDRVRQCPPWEGPFYIATLLQVHPSYDLELSELIQQSNVVKKYKGKYISNGSKRVVRASSIAGRVIWRDSFTRDVMCSQEGWDKLRALGVPEWGVREVEVLDDRN
ncbi:hypothetical protein RA25_11500 [Leisingera sp. ANG-S5]|nr:hypothetical protein RA25_11500 [Leisingera sp. ANG-S5]